MLTVLLPILHVQTYVCNTCVYIYIYMYVCVCVCVCSHICMHMYMYMHMHFYMHARRHTSLHTHTHTCIYIYTLHTHTHTHTCTHIHAYIHPYIYTHTIHIHKQAIHRVLTGEAARERTNQAQQETTPTQSSEAQQNWRENVRFSAQSIASAASTLGAAQLSNHALAVEALAVEGTVCVCVCMYVCMCM
jgi:hypothetical protein